MTVYEKGVSVLMPGEEMPTFIAHPAPAPHPPEHIPLSLHQHKPWFGSVPDSLSILDHNEIWNKITN